ncbi:hypothetical protein GH714_025456 [Hevea brasiliensis]|uniref:Uncharacterized protein n=1 Tax=Hevea brasiliensis TaxID=3981 RepID=A0A6A6LB79_HEVBR|nr:hypothetical protein GH714_025456 [Hevea brasiliensis]
MKGENFSVKKKSKVIDVDFIASALILPNDGNRIGTVKEAKKFEGYSNPIPIKEIFKDNDDRKIRITVMVEQNAKMDMLINRRDRWEWFMKKVVQKLFGESFRKFREFGSYPHGTASTSNAKEASSSGRKISKMKEEEENVAIDEKGNEESKQAEVKEKEKNDEKGKLQKRNQKKKESNKEKSNETSLSHIKSNNSSENGKSGSNNVSSQEEEKRR